MVEIHYEWRLMIIFVNDCSDTTLPKLCVSWIRKVAICSRIYPLQTIPTVWILCRISFLVYKLLLFVPSCSINRSFLWIRLATDLAHHLSIFPKLSNLVTTGFDTTRADHHKLLLFLIMTSADLSDQTKNWKSSRNAAVRHAIQFNYTTLYQLVIQFQFSINCS